MHTQAYNIHLRTDISMCARMYANLYIPEWADIRICTIVRLYKQQQKRQQTAYASEYMAAKIYNLMIAQHIKTRYNQTERPNRGRHQKK